MLVVSFNPGRSSPIYIKPEVSISSGKEHYPEKKNEEAVVRFDFQSGTLTVWKKKFWFQKAAFQISKAKILKDSVHETFAINTLDWKECMWMSELFSLLERKKDSTVWGEKKRIGRQDDLISLSFSEKHRGPVLWLPCGAETRVEDQRCMCVPNHI